ncbi:integrase catalytic domain-containing protein [Trichonephila clavipes]|nr:integrase catalytic domain-containing protein [Trichonephila clavipes]
MGNLPYERVNMAPPFSITGLDLGGPYFVTYKHQRKGVLNKIYVCVCICFVTRAIHLEILSDLTSDAIIATLKRFMSRRGKCSKIFTDNATNFVGANSQLKVLVGRKSRFCCKGQVQAVQAVAGGCRRS